MMKMTCTGKRNQKIVDEITRIKVSFSRKYDRKYDDYYGNTMLRLACSDENNTYILLVKIFQRVLPGTNLSNPVKSLERGRKSCL